MLVFLKGCVLVFQDTTQLSTTTTRTNTEVSSQQTSHQTTQAAGQTSLVEELMIDPRCSEPFVLPEQGTMPEPAPSRYAEDDQLSVRQFMLNYANELREYIRMEFEKIKVAHQEYVDAC